jgi:N,N-dimethylformamidase
MTDDDPILGYCDPWSVETGGAVKLMLSAPGECDITLVRLLGGGPRPEGEPSSLRFETVATPTNGRYAARRRSTNPGSYAVVPTMPNLKGLAEFTFTAWIWPTSPESTHPQAIWSTWPARGFGISLLVDEGGHLAVRSGSSWDDSRVATTDLRVTERRWQLVSMSVDLTARSASLLLGGHPRDRRQSASAAVDLDTDPSAVLTSTHSLLGAGDLVAGVSRTADGPQGARSTFNGKIDAPRLLGRAVSAADLERTARDAMPEDARLELYLGWWDFSQRPGTRTIVDRSSFRRDGYTVNSPARAMTGHDWRRDAVSWTAAPEQYGAIHFHDDDLDDARWSPNVTMRVPDGTPSGVYAARVQSNGTEEFIPFFVKPRAGSPSAKAVVVMPTFTYLAYSNIETSMWDPTLQTGSSELVSDPIQSYISDHREIGWSAYNTHTDGSGVCHISRFRPLVTVKPGYRWWMNGGGWGLSSDLYLIEWLEHEGITYDVVTDHDLHEAGAAALAGYDVVLTGSHPEYVSTEILDAFDAHLDSGGNLMYLGGNGAYWVTSVLPDRPHVVEIRRGSNGNRAWTGGPGETDHSSTGEPGGLWRDRGRAPQALFGVGFASEGGGGGAPYRLTPAADDPRVAFVLDGVDRTQDIGAFGNCNGFAAGDEVDRADVGLGTPPHALVIATSQGLHDDNYQVTVEETMQVLPNLGGTESDLVRADMTYFETGAGGAVFSVGSIDWIGSLSHDGFDNAVARITHNVLAEFGGAPPRTSS